MAFRLGDAVIRGELFNTSKYSVHGWIQLRDQEQRLIFELTGDCDPDLAGKHIRFEAPPDGRYQNDEVNLEGLTWRQIGPTGVMTAARMVRVCECPAAEMYRRCKLGEPPPTEWKRCLTIEWYGQNGRVLVELADPTIIFVDDDGAERLSTLPSPLPREIEEMEPPGKTGLGITRISRNEDGGLDVDEMFLTEEASMEGDLFGEDNGPDALQRQLDAETRDIDRAIGVEEDEETARFMRETELMDDLITQSDGQPILTIFENPEQLPKADTISDAEAEMLLKALLGQMALFGIALNICEHCTPRDAYRLLVEEIATEGTFHPEMRGTEWVQHFMTSEFCPECEAELDREFEERERDEDAGV
jgi:hypothetical protein